MQCHSCAQLLEEAGTRCNVSLHCSKHAMRTCAARPILDWPDGCSRCHCSEVRSAPLLCALENCSLNIVQGADATQAPAVKYPAIRMLSARSSQHPAPVMCVRALCFHYRPSVAAGGLPLSCSDLSGTRNTKPIRRRPQELL